ncbi:MAG TPA: hypothetical protein VK890_03885, partial [Bacteroidia bacterium]|nr:hypothetical protein [Bacteroidia bacterium]
MLQTDYAAASDKTETILNDLFAADNNNNPIQWENLNYFEQATALFSRTAEAVRQPQVYIGYNLQRAFLPAVHILLPQETPGRYDSIGLKDNIAPIYNPNATVPYEMYANVLTYRANFDLLVTSDNATDILLIYYALKAMLAYVVDTFEIFGLHNCKSTGMDVQLDPAYAPPNIFHRTLRLEFDYESQIQIRRPKQFASAMAFAICANIGDENAPPNSTPQVGVMSNNFIINVTKIDQSGVVGYVEFTNKVTGDTALVNLNLTGQPNNFDISADLTPSNYDIIINLQNFSGNIIGEIDDNGGING